MVDVAQLVERLVVAQVAVGSSPIIHPIFNPSVPLKNDNNGAWRSPVSAPALGAGSRKFKSSRPDTFRVAPIAQLDRATVF